MVLLLHAQLLNLLSDGHLEPGCVCVVPIRPNGRGFLMFLVAQGVVPRRQPGPFSKLREKKTQGFAAATQVVSAGLELSQDGWFQSTVLGSSGATPSTEIKQKTTDAGERQQTSRYHQARNEFRYGCGSELKT